MTQQPPPRIFLDMDGVLCDFAGAALRANGMDDADIEWGNATWDLQKLCNVSLSEFWHNIDANGEEFWSELDPYPWADEVVNAAIGVVGLHNVYLVTSPSRTAHCYSGKAIWVANNFPNLRNRLILTGHKHLMARRETLLVDDGEHNFRDFLCAGGFAHLFPQVWNSGKHLLANGRDISQTCEVMKDFLTILQRNGKA